MQDHFRDVEDMNPTLLAKSAINSLQQLEKLVLDLDKFITYESTTIPIEGEAPRVDKSVVLRKTSRINKFKDDLRQAKTSVQSSLTLLSSSLGLRGLQASISEFPPLHIH